MQNMTPAEINSFLMDTVRTGKLATVRADGRPHVVPIWYYYEDDVLVFNTWHASVKARNMQRDNRVSICVDEEVPPFAFVMIEGTVTLTDNDPDTKMWATKIGGRYMGAENAEAFGERNSVPGALVVRLTPTRIIAKKDVSS